LRGLAGDHSRLLEDHYFAQNLSESNDFYAETFWPDFGQDCSE